MCKGPEVYEAGQVWDCREVAWPEVEVRLSRGGKSVLY